MSDLQLTKRLKIACVVIYSAVIILLGVLIADIIVVNNRENKIANQTIELEDEGKVTKVPNVNINVYGDNNVVYNNTFFVYDNTINRYVSNPDYGIWASKIMNETREWSKGTFTMEDAISLVAKITNAARDHGLKDSIAFAIVSIESDFKSSAKNAGWDARGLCQVTKPCLDEYNNNHPDSTYSMDDMYNDVFNLEVGFWFYKRILTHYNDHYKYITETNDYTKLRDAYICYNYGTTAFHEIGYSGRHELRKGVYPKYIVKGKNYGGPVGSPYTPMSRFNEKYDAWI